MGDKGAAHADNNRANDVEVSTACCVAKEKPLFFFLESCTQAYIDKVLEFAKAIENGTDVVCSGIDGLQAEKIARAAKQFLETGMPVQL